MRDTKTEKFYYLSPVTQKNPHKVHQDLKRGAVAICHTHPNTDVIPTQVQDPIDYSGPISSYTAGSTGRVWLIEPNKIATQLGPPGFIPTGKSPDAGSPTPSGWEFLDQ